MDVRTTTVKNTEEGGVTIADSVRVDLEKSSFKGNGGTGLDIRNISQLRINDVDAIENDGFGIFVRRSTDMSISSVESIQNLEVDIRVSESPNTTVTNVNASGNGETSAISVFDSPNTVVENVVANTSSLGIHIINSSGTTVNTATVANNSMSGIAIDSSNVDLKNLVVTNNGRRSISVQGGSTQERYEPTVVENISLGDAPVIARGSIRDAYLDVQGPTDDGITELPSGWVSTGDVIKVETYSGDGHVSLALAAPNEVADSVATSSIRTWKYNETWQPLHSGGGTDDPGAEVNVTGSATMGIFGQQPPVGTLQLEEVTATSPARPEETVTISTTVTNPTEQWSIQEVTLSAGDTKIDATMVTLAPGESRELTFQWEIREDTDTVVVNTATANDTAWTVVTVGSAQRGNYSVDIAQPEKPVVQGENATIRATLTNNDEQAGNQTVVFIANGKVISQWTVSLRPGESTEITLTWDTDGLRGGQHTVYLASAGVTAETIVRIAAGDGGTDSNESTPSEDTSTPMETTTVTPDEAATTSQSVSQTESATPVSTTTVVPTASGNSQQVETTTSEAGPGFGPIASLISLLSAVALALGKSRNWWRSA